MSNDIAHLPAVNHQVDQREADRYDGRHPVTTVCGARVFPTVDANRMGPCPDCESGVAL